MRNTTKEKNIAVWILQFLGELERVIFMEKEIYNARITDTRLGYNDWNQLTFSIYTDSEYGICGFGGCQFGKRDDFAIDEVSRLRETKYINFEWTSELIMKLLDVVGVDKWENIKGKLIRIRTNGKTGSAGGIEAIGNILENKWFSIQDFYAEKGIYE